MLHSWESRRPFKGPYDRGDMVRWSQQWISYVYIYVRYADTGVYSGSWVTVGCPQAGFGLVCTNLATPGHQNMQWRINRIECGQNHPTASRQHILRQAIFCCFD